MNITNFPENESELFSKKKPGTNKKTLKMSLKNHIILVPFCVFFSPSSILTPQVSVYFKYLKFNTPAKKTNRLSTSPLFFGGSKKSDDSFKSQAYHGWFPHAVFKNGQHRGSCSARRPANAVPVPLPQSSEASLGSAAWNLR